MIPQETVDKILDAAQIVDVVSDYVTLKRRGSGYVACCPFHNEKTPSFHVSPSKGIYKCFGCGKAGSAVNFVMEQESLTYPEALRLLARKYHIEVQEKEESAEDIARKQHRDSLLVVSKFAYDFFRSQLQTPDGKAIAYNYFRGKRRLEDSTIEKYGLGWAPKSRDALSRAAREAGYKEEYLVETGLSIRKDDGSLVDRFYDRVMFPIHSVTGQVIAFGGRTLRTDKEIAKYVNSPETEIYVKNRSLYGIYFAKQEISRQRKCILVEGYLDVLSMHQVGVMNVVASSGTSLTVGQVALIKRFADDVTIIYDGDSAGIHAAIRGIGLVLKGGLNVRVVLLPDGQDPDDFAKSHTLAEVQDYIKQNEQDFIGFMTDILLGEAGSDPLKRSALINEVADTIALIPDQITRAMYIQSCAAKFRTDEQLLYDRVRHTRDAMLLAEKRQNERDAERARREGGAEGSSQDGASRGEGDAEGNPVAAETSASERIGVLPDGAAPQKASGPREEEPLTAPVEREILCFLLEYGDNLLKFDSDSPLYDSESPEPTVADFILNTLEGNGIVFHNSMYAALLQQYTSLYDSGLQQSQILTRLRDSQDPATSSAARDLLFDKYSITVKNFENTLTSSDTVLVTYIPKLMIRIQLMNTELVLKNLQKVMLTSVDPAEQEKALAAFAEQSRIKSALSNQLAK